MNFIISFGEKSPVKNTGTLAILFEILFFIRKPSEFISFLNSLFRIIKSGIFLVASVKPSVVYNEVWTSNPFIFRKFLIKSSNNESGKINKIFLILKAPSYFYNTVYAHYNLKIVTISIVFYLEFIPAYTFSIFCLRHSEKFLIIEMQ